MESSTRIPTTSERPRRVIKLRVYPAAYITRNVEIKDAGIALDINVLDHIIIGNESYFSFSDEGLL